MKFSAFTILIALTSTAAIAQTSPLRPGALSQATPQVIRGLTADTGRPQNSAGFVCPHEFGCGGVEEFFHAIGGHCVNDPEQGIFCEGPDGPEVPHPE